MSKVASIIAVLFILLLFCPHSSGLRLIDDGEDRVKYGDYGDEITYHIIVKNDSPNSKDIIASIGDHTWNVSITEDEYLNVAENENVAFEVIVEIPNETDELISETYVHIWERDHIPIVSDFSNEGYEHSIRVELTTGIIEKENNPSSLNEIVDNNPLMIVLVGLILLTGYLWHGRKYYFLTPLYMHIPKEKLLDQENREKISRYLLMYNGSNLSQISQGTGINASTLRHHMRLFAQSNVVLKKDKRFFIREPDKKGFDTKILSPGLQRVFTIIQNVDGITMSNLASTIKRSKPWIGNRIHELLALDYIEIQKAGRFKHIYPKGLAPNSQSSKSHENNHPITG